VLGAQVRQKVDRLEALLIVRRHCITFLVQIEDPAWDEKNVMYQYLAL
jgi:hypothetical protein